ncbi:cytochrome oxidase small assembly protein [Ramlibacter lithotrophicus]
MTDRDERKHRNLRMALVLATIAGAFFLGVIAKFVLFGG